jgi:gluconolactonase
MPNLQQTPLPAGFIDAGAQVTPATAVAFLEGPAADANGHVYFSDIINNRILKLDSRTSEFSVWRADSGRSNGLLFDAQGRLLACEGNEFGGNGNRRITRTDMKTGHVEVLTDRFEGKRYNAPNDIAARSNGQIFFTDPSYDRRQEMELSHESVYRIDTNGTVTRIITGPDDIQRPNGIALSPDERTLYVVDSNRGQNTNRKIWAFDLDPAGKPSGHRLVFDFAPGRGGDGMAVDIEGNLYIAAGVHRARNDSETTDVPTGIYVISPTGKLHGRIPIPEDIITNVTFGGDDLRTLYITSGKTLWQIRVKIPGFVVHRKAASR